MQDLDEATRKYLAWESILAEKDDRHLNLTPQQVKQAETQLAAADGTVTARIPEVYQWLLVPVQKSPQARHRVPCNPADVGTRCAGRAHEQEAPERRIAGHRFAGTVLKRSSITCRSGEAITSRSNSSSTISHGTFTSLGSRISEVLVGGVRDGVAMLTWQEETFAYADSYDEAEDDTRVSRWTARRLLTPSRPASS